MSTRSFGKRKMKLDVAWEPVRTPDKGQVIFSQDGRGVCRLQKRLHAYSAWRHVQSSDGKNGKGSSPRHHCRSIPLRCLIARLGALLFEKCSCPSLKCQRVDVSSSSSTSLSSQVMFGGTSMSSSRGRLPFTLSILAREKIYG